jgi:hypothetical protein
MGCLFVVFLQAIASSDKTEEDKDLIEKIRKELTLLPGAGKK